MKLPMIVAVLSAIALVGADDEVAEYQISLKREADQVLVSQKKDVTVFKVVSASGIGSATIARGRQPWPDQALVRLSYTSGKGFENLEGFTITNSTIRIESGLTVSGKVIAQLHRADDKEGGPGEELDTAAMSLRVTPAGIEVRLPMKLLAPQPQFTIDWVDAYRN